MGRGPSNALPMRTCVAPWAISRFEVATHPGGNHGGLRICGSDPVRDASQTGKGRLRRLTQRGDRHHSRKD